MASYLTTEEERELARRLSSDDVLGDRFNRFIDHLRVLEGLSREDIQAALKHAEEDGKVGVES